MGSFSVFHWLIVTAFIWLEYAFAMWILKHFLFQEAAPLKRAAGLTAAAWLAWSCVFALRAQTPTDLVTVPAFFALYGIPVFAGSYWFFRRREQKVAEHWDTFE